MTHALTSIKSVENLGKSIILTVSASISYVRVIRGWRNEGGNVEKSEGEVVARSNIRS